MTQRNEQNGGHDTDGEGSEGIADDKSREDQVDETDTTGIDDDEEEDEDSPGMVRPQTARDLEEARSEDLEG
jgi:hypothetical protein